MNCKVTPETWKNTILEDVCFNIFSGGTPSRKEAGFWNGDINWFSSGETRNRFIKSTEEKITQVGVDKSSTKLSIPNDVLMASAGQGFTRGQVSYNLIDTYINQSVVSLRADSEKLDSRFLFYNLSGRYEELRKISDGNSIRGSITTKMLKKFPILLPPLIEQKFISKILSSLDDKIETNNAIIANLEAQAQAIFKSWFVDFEPFQDGQFVESELGMIPEGWEVKTLGDFFPVITGKKNANIAIDNGEYPFFTCSQGIFYTDDYSFDANAILLAGNGDFNVKRYNGKFEAYQRTYILIPYDEKYVGLLYNLIEFYLPQIVSGHKGSVINYITKGMIEEFKFAVPNDMPAKTLKLFNDYENFIAHLKKEVKNLEITRDTLLPKLMSGEIRVGQDDIEEIENLL